MFHAAAQHAAPPSPQWLRVVLAITLASPFLAFALGSQGRYGATALCIRVGVALLAVLLWDRGREHRLQRLLMLGQTVTAIALGEPIYRALVWPEAGLTSALADDAAMLVLAAVVWALSLAVWLWPRGEPSPGRRCRADPGRRGAADQPPALCRRACPSQM